MINVGVSVKNQMIGVVVQMTKFGILVRVIVSAIRHVKLTVIQILKSSSRTNSLFGKLVLTCEGDISNTTDTSLDDKTVACEKNSCLIHTISLVIICL